MELDRDLILQVGISVAVVAVFVIGLAWLSGAYGIDDTVENESLEGTIDGHFEGDADDGPVTLTFQGTFENDIEATVEGDIDGEIQGETLSGEFDGEIHGAIDGTLTGTITDGTVDRDTGTLQGDFEGTADGTTAMDLTDQGGLVLVALLAAFILLMPAFGYLIRRLETDDGD